MKILFLTVALSSVLFACTWETYDSEGKTRLRQKYPVGTSVYYEDGTYSQDQRYNNYRSKQHAIEPIKKVD